MFNKGFSRNGDPSIDGKGTAKSNTGNLDITGCENHGDLPFKAIFWEKGFLFEPSPTQKRTHLTTNHQLT